MEWKREYELSDIGGEPLLNSGFENEEPEQSDEPTEHESDSGLDGSAA